MVYRLYKLRTNPVVRRLSIAAPVIGLVMGVAYFITSGQGTANAFSLVIPFPVSFPVSGGNNPPQPTHVLYKQADAQWGSQEYAFANSYGGYDCGKTIAQCGCALTSAAMLLRYYGYTKLPDGTALNPGTLNTWLKANSGYDKPNGNVMFPKIGTFSKSAKAINNITAFNGLEFKGKFGQDVPLLKSNLSTGWPTILGVKGNSHFVLATGISGSTFTINDPGKANITLLSDPKYGNNFTIRQFQPSKTDLSYFVVATDPGVDVKIVDNNGNPVGVTDLEPSILDPDDPGPAKTFTKYIYVEQPASGSYKIIANNTDKPSEIRTFIYDVDGNSTEDAKPLPVGSKPVTFDVTFDKADISKAKVETVVGDDEEEQEVPETGDKIAPQSTATPTSPANISGWHKANVTVNLAATDNTGGSGVKEIVYSLSGAQILAQTTVAGASVPVAISTEGTTTINYFARDNAGNAETTKQLTIKLDKTAPELAVQNNRAAKKILGSGTDGISGIQKTTQTTSNLEVTDNAGNTTKLNLATRKSSHDVLYATANKLTYNGVSRTIPKIDIKIDGHIERSWLFTTYETVIQEFKINKQESVNATYKEKTNRTEITAKKGSQTTNSNVEGYKGFVLKTSKGAVSIQ